MTIHGFVWDYVLDYFLTGSTGFLQFQDKKYTSTLSPAKQCRKDIKCCQRALEVLLVGYFVTFEQSQASCFQPLC